MILKDSVGKIVAQEPVSSKTGYGVIHARNLTAGDYQLQVVNFGNPSTENDFTISLYAQTQIEILGQHKFLLAAIERAELDSPLEIIESKVKKKDIDQTGKTFLDETKQLLHITLQKHKKHKAIIMIELQTSTPTFPSLSTQSNIQWK